MTGEMPPVITMPYRRSYSNLCAASLTAGQHERTCGYWFTVTSGALAHTAFATRAGLDHWLAERALALEKALPEAGTHGFTRIIGEYRTASWGEFLDDDPRLGMGPGAFYSLHPIAATAEMDNANYTLALITEEDGVRVINFLNCNVRSRVIFDRRNTQRWLES